MFDEHAFIARLEAADTDELAQIVARPTGDEEQALRTYLGDECYQRLHSLALRRAMMQSLRASQRRPGKEPLIGKAVRARKALPPEPSRNVIIIPGILGSELTSTDKNGKAERLWLNPRRIVTGDITRLRLDANGLNDADPRYTINATGIMKRYYGELMLTLGLKWNAHAFWYDWRKDLNVTAAQLHARINALFPSDEAVQIVAHSIGGLVARTYLANYNDEWGRISRLIMLGTPNHGLYTAPLALTGQLDMIRWIDQLDPYHDAAEIQAVVASFPGFYQLLPSPYRAGKPDGQSILPDEQLLALYNPNHYKPLAISKQHLELARAHHYKLIDVVAPQHMVYIGGYGQPTIVDLACLLQKPADNCASDDAEDDPLKGAAVGLDGDGSVAHELGVLVEHATQAPVPALFVRANHAELHSHPNVLAAIDGLLQLPAKLEAQTLQQKLGEIAADTDLELALPSQPPAETKTTADTNLRPRIKQTQAENNRLVEGLTRTLTRSNQNERPYAIPEERSIEELLTRGLILVSNKERSFESTVTFQPPSITIDLVHGDITALNKLPANVDAIAIGHYRGDQAQGLLHTLDEALNCQHQPATNAAEVPAHKGLLTELAERGSIRAELADIFLVNDPRLTQPITIAIAGKGVPGRFSAPEATVLARELCWTLGRLCKRHLVTVLIGGGRTTTSVSDAVSAWMRGIKGAITGMHPAHTLDKITFFEIDPTRVLQIDSALKQQSQYFQEKQRMIVRYAEKTPSERKKLRAAIKPYFQDVVQPVLLKQMLQHEHEELTPMRVTVGLEGGTYVFGAVSHHASIPEREIPLDPRLVTQANQEIVAESNPQRQLQLGQFMERLLIPHDLRHLFTTPAPIVMTVDATTARIHWEMLAQSDPTTLNEQRSDGEDRNQYFLGISRGFTRQLRTRFAPLPQPPPPVKRLLRVLVVADPAADAHLPGAEEEGVAVADLFAHFNVAHPKTVENRVEVVRLFGPREATRTAVLRHLMMHSYNVLHFAGHCVYDQENPGASGWIFSNGERICANELRRIDRVPTFVFSNACESGVTPDRASERSADLAPSFAEAFFAQGVANFVCTAWPVDDRAARDFALTLYAGLLGLDGDLDGGDAKGHTQQGAPRLISVDLDECKASVPQPIFQALRNARQAIANPPNDIRTWGAYQHYGDPYFRLFDPSGWQRLGEVAG